VKPLDATSFAKSFLSIIVRIATSKYDVKVMSTLDFCPSELKENMGIVDFFSFIFIAPRL